jgi:hypothetical protein
MRRHSVWLILLVDALITAPFVFRHGVEGDTLRYALDSTRWRAGELALPQLFNAELSFGYYGLVRLLAATFRLDLASLPFALNLLSLVAGIGGVACLYLWWRRWFGPPAAFRLAGLWLLSPAWWSAQLYGNANVVGLSLAAAAAAALPSGAFSGARARGETGRFVLRAAAAGALGTFALCVRMDVAMLATGILAWAFWGKEKPGVRTVLAWGLACAAAAFLARAVYVGVATGSGTVGFHWRNNFALGAWSWFYGNVAALGFCGPPLVLGASLAALLAWRSRGSGTVRATAVLWALPAAIFILFARIHLSRILLPILPAFFLPLAAWAAEDRHRRDGILISLALGAQLVMLPVPDALARLGLRSPHGGRTNHYLFLGNMVSDHFRIARNARDLMQDAFRFAAEPADPPLPTPAVIGEDVIFYEYALKATVRDAKVRTLKSGYLLRLQEVTNGPRMWLLLTRGRPGDPQALLSEMGWNGPVRVHRTPEDLRHFEPLSPGGGKP